MSHIKGYLQFISEQNKGDDIAAEIKKKKDIIKGLRNTPNLSNQKTIEKIEQEIQDLKAEKFVPGNEIKIELLPIHPVISSEPADPKLDPKKPDPKKPDPKKPDAKNPDPKKPDAKNPDPKPVQMSSGRGNEALRARNIAKAKARKQNPTVNTKPTLNKAGTDSGSGVDALKQRMIKRSEERGK